MDTLGRSTLPLVVSVSACLPLRVLADEAERLCDFCEWEDSLDVVRERASMLVGKQLLRCC